MTREEYEYLETIKNQKSIIHELENQVSIFKEKLSAKEKVISEKELQTNNLTNHVNKLTRDLSERDIMINHDKHNMAEYKLYYDRAKNLEVQLRNLENQHKSVISIKDLQIENLKKKRDEMYNQIEELESELEDYRDEEEEDDDELVHVSDPLEQGGVYGDGGELDTYKMPDEDKGLELHEKQTKELVQLIDGGQVNIEKVLDTVKKNLGGQLTSQPDVIESEKTINAIKLELDKNKGKIHDSVLAQFKNIQYFDTDTALKKFKVIGNNSFIMKKNFLSPTWSIYNL